MNYKVLADFNKNALFDHELSDITSRVMFPLTWSNGVMNSDGTEDNVSTYVGTGTNLMLQLDNRDGELSQDNTEGAYYGLFKQGILMRVTVEADITYSFSYHLIDFTEQLGEYGQQIVQVVAYEALDRAIDQSFSPKFYENLTTDSAIRKAFSDYPNLILPYDSEYFYIGYSTLGTYYKEIADIEPLALELLLVPNGDTFKEYDLSGSYGTNTSEGEEDILHYRSVAFDGSTSYVDASALMSGSMPANFSASIRVQLTDYTPSASEHLFKLTASSGDSYTLYVNSSGVLTFEHLEDVNTTSLTYDISAFVGVHTFTVTVNGTALTLYVNGSSVDTDTAGTSATGTVSALVIGASSASPANVLDGLIFDVVMYNTALTASQVSDIYNLSLTYVEKLNQSVNVETFLIPDNTGYFTQYGVGGQYGNYTTGLGNFDTDLNRYGIYLNGNGSFIVINDLYPVSVPSAMTVIMEIEPDSLVPATIQYIYRLRINASNLIYMYHNTTGAIVLTYLVSGSGTSVATSTTLPSGKFQIAFTIDGTAIKLYLNGVNVSNSTAGSALTGTIASVLIGTNSFGSTLRYAGNIYSIMTDNTQALSGTDIANLYAVTAPDKDIHDSSHNELLFDGTTTPDNYLDFETGLTTLTYVGDVVEPEQNETRLYNYIQDIVQAEAFGRFYYDARNIKYVFHNRYHDINRDTVDTFTTEDIAQAITTRDKVFNEITIYYEPRNVGDPSSLLFFSDSVPFTVSPKSDENEDTNKKVIRVRYKDPDEQAKRVSAFDVIEPVLGTDIIAYDEEDGTGSIRTSDLIVSIDIGATSAEITLRNKGQTRLYVTKLQLRGTPLRTYNKETITQENADSIYNYNRFGLPPMTFKALDDGDLLDRLASVLQGRYASPTTRITTLMLALRDDDHTFNNRVLRLSVGDSFNVQDSFTGHNRRYTIYGEAHTVMNNMHTVSFMLRPRDFANYFVINTDSINGSNLIGY